MKAIEPGHVYLLDNFEVPLPEDPKDMQNRQGLTFVNKFNPGQQHHGTTNEEVLAMLIDRMKFFQKDKFACRENAIVITKLEEALMWLNYRTRKRADQGVEGKNKAHVS